jgi:hypothetical protein
MTTFNITQLESTASPLYSVEVLDDAKTVITTLQIAANEGDDVKAIAQEAYDLIINPPKLY